MIQFLTILFIIIFFQIIIFGLIFSTITLEVDKCKFSYNEIEVNKFKFKELEISIKLYLFKFIKILSIKIFKDYLTIFGIKIRFDLINKIKFFEENYKKIYWDFKEIFKNRKYLNLKLINPRLKVFKFYLDFGISSQMITTFLVPVLSTVLSFILRNSISNYNINNYSYKITPKYVNKNFLRLNFQTKLNFNTINLIIFYLNIKNVIRKKIINSSNRISKIPTEKNIIYNK